LAQDLLGWINLKPTSGLAANVGNAAFWDGLIAVRYMRHTMKDYIDDHDGSLLMPLYSVWPMINLD